MNSLKNFWERLKKVKHIEVYLTIVAALVIIVIYLSSLGIGKKSNQTAGDNLAQNSTTEFSSSAEYVSYLENKLVNVLSGVKGTSKVSVIISLSSGFEYEYATEEETVKTSDGSVTTTKVVIVDGKPVITKEHYPVIKGIVVVAKGAEDIAVRMNLLSVIQTVVEVDDANVTILAAN